MGSYSFSSSSSFLSGIMFIIVAITFSFLIYFSSLLTLSCPLIISPLSIFSLYSLCDALISSSISYYLCSFIALSKSWFSILNSGKDDTLRKIKGITNYFFPLLSPILSQDWILFYKNWHLDFLIIFYCPDSVKSNKFFIIFLDFFYVLHIFIKLLLFLSSLWLILNHNV